jgi:hypothetical protein
MPYWHCFLVERREDLLVRIHLFLILEVLKRGDPVKIPPMSLLETHKRERERLPLTPRDDVPSNICIMNVKFMARQQHGEYVA